MKKLSYKYKMYLERKRLRYKRKKSNCNKSRYKETHKTHIIPTPQAMNLKDNYQKTVLFFNKVRKACDSKKYFEVDFTKLKNITPSAALILTSEMDRICITKKGKGGYDKKSRKKRKYGLKVLNFKKWDKKIKVLLEDMGMHKLLRIPNWKKSKNKIETDEIFLPFQKGEKVLNEEAINLRNLLNELLKKEVPNSSKLQIGLTEAMTNSLHHAYPKDYQNLNELKKEIWWMSASFNKKTKSLKVMFFDQGIGIPSSLKKNFSEHVSFVVAKLLKNKNIDGNLIKAATEIGRSGTQEGHRGNGLKDIKNYVSDLEDGYLRIMSRRGEFLYSKKDDNKKEMVYNRKEELGGTLIEWQAYIN